MRLSPKIALATAALVLAAGNAALAGLTREKPAPSAVSAAPPRTIGAFALARLLSEAPPDAVVITLDEARHPLRGAQPLALFGEGDEALVQRAPRERRIVLAGLDVVREDRLARRLADTGRDVTILAGGLGAWDQAMDADPPAPASGAPRAEWQAYRSNVALRRSFGDAAPATAPVIAPAVPASAGPGGGPAKKREGC